MFGEVLIWFTVAFITIFATVTDLKRYIIPDKLILAGIAIIMLLHVSFDFFNLWKYILHGILFFLGMWGLAILSNGKIGGGDIKLFAFLAFAIGGYAALWIFIYSHLLGGIVVLILYLLGRMERKSNVPFAPFILFGFAIILTQRILG